MTGVCSFRGFGLEISKRNKEIAINNFSLIPPGIWKDMRPWSCHQFSISFCSIIFSLLMTSFPTSALRAIPDPHAERLQRTKFQNPEENVMLILLQSQSRHWGCFRPTWSAWASVNASEPHIFSLPSINFCLPFQKTSRHSGFKPN